MASTDSEGTYRTIASRYDRLIGRAFFRGLRPAFEFLVCRYGIRFRSAADLGCGTGLFARYLNRCWGVPVFGVDRSASMLRAAKRPCTSGVRYLRQDLRTLSLPCRVDLVTANHDTLNHLLELQDLDAALGRIRGALNPCGHVLFDVLTPAALTMGEQRFFRTLPSGEKTLHTVRAVGPDGLFETVLSHESPGRTQTVVRNVERAYELSDIRQLMERACFRVRGVHNAATLAPSDAGSGRVIVVAVAQLGGAGR